MIEPENKIGTEDQIGITEQIAFPEIEYDKIDMIRGLDVAITTTAGSNERGIALLKAFNFPLKAK